jgi:hypothetical protein
MFGRLCPCKNLTCLSAFITDHKRGGHGIRVYRSPATLAERFQFSGVQADRRDHRFDLEARRASFISNRGVWFMAKKDTYRIVTRGVDGSLRIRDFPNADPILRMHTQIGVDDSSADLELRGMPVFRGLIGPIPEGKNIVRYESPEVFETVTKEWSNSKIKRRRRRTQALEVEAIEDSKA